MRESPWNASPEEIEEQTGKIVAWMVRDTAAMSDSDQIVHVYNQAIDDVASALSKFARRNPQHAAGLTLATDWLRTNFTLKVAPP